MQSLTSRWLIMSHWCKCIMYVCELLPYFPWPVLFACFCRRLPASWTWELVLTWSINAGVRKWFKFAVFECMKGCVSNVTSVLSGFCLRDSEVCAFVFVMSYGKLQILRMRPISQQRNVAFFSRTIWPCHCHGQASNIWIVQCHFFR